MPSNLLTPAFGGQSPPPALAFGDLDGEQAIAPSEAGPSQACAASVRIGTGSLRELAHECIIGGVLRALAEHGPQPGVPADVMLQHLAQARMTGINHAGGEVGEHGHIKVVVHVRQANAPFSFGERVGEPVDLGVRNAPLNDIVVDGLAGLGQWQIEPRTCIPEELCDPHPTVRVEIGHTQQR